jgi:hypothetical protein
MLKLVIEGSLSAVLPNYEITQLPNYPILFASIVKSLSKPSPNTLIDKQEIQTYDHRHCRIREEVGAASVG